MSDREIDVVRAGIDRRALVTKLAVGAFAVPAIVAFKLDSLARAGTFSQHPSRHSDPGCHLPNGTQANGTLPNGWQPNGTIANSTVPVGTLPDGAAPPDDDGRKGRRKGHGR